MRERSPKPATAPSRPSETGYRLGTARRKSIPSRRLLRAALCLTASLTLAAGAPVTTGAPAAAGAPAAVTAPAAAHALVTAGAPVTAPATVPSATSCTNTSMNIVAHQDDDILFINPDVYTDVKAKRCIVTVFLTAGDAGRSARYWRGREFGAMSAYAKMAGVTSRWASGSVRLAGHRITRVSLVGRQISLLFLRLPDGHGYADHNWETLQKLWYDTMPAIHSIDSARDAYTRDSLTDTLNAAMRIWKPDVVRTLDYSAGYGRGDHGDHLSAAYFTYAAHLSYTTRHRLYGYRGYPISDEPVNLSPASTKAKMTIFFAYAPHDETICKTVKACKKKAYWSWFSRQYRTTGAPNLDGHTTGLPPGDRPYRTH